VRSTAIALALLAALVTSCGRSTDGKFGSELYEISCAGCHGADGQGNVIGPDIASSGSRAARELADDQLAGAIRVGPGAMPGNPRLSDEQIASLVEYLRGLQDAP
jgi:mono/diheme cytochrome c family protein